MVRKSSSRRIHEESERPPSHWIVSTKMRCGRVLVENQGKKDERKLIIVPQGGNRTDELGVHRLWDGERD